MSGEGEGRHAREIAEARRLIKSGVVSMIVAALASGAALAAFGPRSAGFILASAISVLAVLRTGQGLARLRRLRAYREGAAHKAASR